MCTLIWIEISISVERFGELTGQLNGGLGVKPVYRTKYILPLLLNKMGESTYNYHRFKQNDRFTLPLGPTKLVRV